MEKKNIFFIQPLFYKPTLPNFKDRFELLSEKCRGHVVSASAEGAEGMRFSEFTYHPLPIIRNRAWKHFYCLWKTVAIGLEANRKERLHYVHSYDPLFYGLAAVIIGFLTGATVIVEVNGNLLGEEFHARRGALGMARQAAIRALVRLTLRRSKKIKFLNSRQALEWDSLAGGEGKACVFHEFVPTHVFDPSVSTDRNYILFMGHPFHVKGVDVLIKAFIKISKKFPGVKLKIVGHCHKRGERELYMEMAEGNGMVEILKPVYYDEAIDLMQGCTFFVLPSRSEAMGRVLIEAMACGKPVIGSNVGGIPEVIEDGGNGFLFEPGDIEGLSLKMERLLSDALLRERMGRRGLEMVEERFSSKKYAEKFYGLLAG